MITKVTVIAEAGVNHDGDLTRAFALIEAAKEAGADYVKFQTFKAESLVTKSAEQADYQRKNIGKNETQLEMLKRLELSYEDHLEIKKHCEKIGIGFFSTAFDLESVKFLNNLGMNLWKIPSGEITNLPYLELIASYKKEVIISTGMATLEEVEAVIAVFENAGHKRDTITVLHCNTDYPTPMCDVNLRAIDTIRNHCRTNVGYSDHTLGIEVPIAAVALGATIIEKHFTLSRDFPGPDHKASLEPKELKEMVRSIRNIEHALGRPEKYPTESERKNISVARKSIVTTRPIQAGEVFSIDNLTTKRPATGISPMRWHEILGTKATRNYSEDEMI